METTMTAPAETPPHGLQALADAQAVQIAKLQAENAIYAAGTAKALEHVRQAGALHLPEGAGRSSIRYRLGLAMYLAHETEHALEEIATDADWPSREEEDA